MIIGTKAMATAPRRLPIHLIAGAWVAHMKFMITTRLQSKYLRVLFSFITPDHYCEWTPPKQ